MVSREKKKEEMKNVREKQLFFYKINNREFGEEEKSLKGKKFVSFD